MEALIEEIKKIREDLNKKPRLNSKRVALLDHLLEIHGKATGQLTGDKPKTWEQLSTLKIAQAKQEKKQKKDKLEPEESEE